MNQIEAFVKYWVTLKAVPAPETTTVLEIGSVPLFIETVGVENNESFLLTTADNEVRTNPNVPMTLAP